MYNYSAQKPKLSLRLVCHYNPLHICMYDSWRSFIWIINHFLDGHVYRRLKLSYRVYFWRIVIRWLKLVQADNFYGRDTSVLNSLARTYLEISNVHCITTPYLDSPDLWNKKDPMSGINFCNLISNQTCLKLHLSSRSMMTSSNGNIFRVTGHLCWEFPGHRWIPRTKASDEELWC